MKKYYLAYGSNLNMRQMFVRCPDAIPIGNGKIMGYRLLFKGSKTGSYLTIEQDDSSYVPVGVWEVSKEDERHLDVYEGYPNFYYKKEIPIWIKDFKTGRKKRVKAFVYIMHEERRCALPTRRYFTTCLEGYKDFEFHTKFLQKAVEDTLEVMNEN